MTREKKTASLNLNQIAAAAMQDVQDAKGEAQETDTRFEITPAVIHFTLAYDAPTGEDHEVQLTSKVLDADGRMAKSRVYAQLTRGINADLASQEDRFRFEALSRAAIQLQEPPEWLVSALGMDLDLLIHINGILVEHENRYFRGNARKGEEGQIKARVRSVVPAFEQAASK